MLPPFLQNNFEETLQDLTQEWEWFEQYKVRLEMLTILIAYRNKKVSVDKSR